MATSKRQDNAYENLHVISILVGGEGGNAYKLPTSDGNTGEALVTDGNGTVSFSSPTGLCIYSKLNVAQTTNLAVTDHIKFDLVLFDNASNISLDTTTAYTVTTGAASIGRFTLAAGKTYYMECWLMQFAATTMVVRWWDATLNAAIDGPIAGTFPGCLAVFTPATSTLVEVRIVNSVTPTSISRSFAKIFQLN
jgi:hypothetical protein